MTSATPGRTKRVWPSRVLCTWAALAGWGFASGPGRWMGMVFVWQRLGLRRRRSWHCRWAAAAARDAARLAAGWLSGRGQESWATVSPSTTAAACQRNSCLGSLHVQQPGNCSRVILTQTHNYQNAPRAPITTVSYSHHGPTEHRRLVTVSPSTALLHARSLPTPRLA